MNTTDDKSKKDWKQLRDRRQLILSASQISTAHLCVRKWWLERVRRLAVPDDPTKFIFGSVFHACVERFLLADDTGRDRKTGKPVDLFPDGWTNDISRYTGEVTGTVSEEDAGVIKALVLKGIETGVLLPYPDRAVEKEIGVTLGKYESEVEGKEPVTVRVVGFIDCVSRNTIIDHKTSSSPRWFQSAKSLGEDIQMLLYGKFLLEDLREAGEQPDKIILRHNQFCKDPNNMQVRETSVPVTPRYVDQFWATVIEPTIRKMVAYRDRADSWAAMPEPATAYRACNKYGGCGYMNVCAGRLTEATMERRLDTQAQTTTLTTSATEIPDKRKDNSMGQSLAEKLAAQKAKRQAAGFDNAPAEEAPKEEPQEETEPAEVDENGMTPPPWASPACSACEGLGFNTVGNPCRVCDNKASKLKPKSESRHYKITSEADGSFVWVNKEDPDDAGVSPGPSFGREEPKKTEQKSKDVEKDVEEEKPKPKPKADKPKGGKTSPAKAPAPEPEETEDNDDDIPGSDGSGSGNFHLYINCRPTKTGKGIPKPTDLHEILEDARVQLAAASDVTSFYELDPFKRKDSIAMLAPQISEHVGKGVLVACGIGTGASEMRVLLDALKPLAKQVIVGDTN